MPAQSRYCNRAAVPDRWVRVDDEHGSQVASPIAMSLALA